MYAFGAQLRPRKMRRLTLVDQLFSLKVCIVEYFATSLANAWFPIGSVLTQPHKGWSLMSGVVGSVDSLTRGLAVDLAPIRVNVVSPGMVKTEVGPSHVNCSTYLYVIFDGI